MKNKILIGLFIFCLALIGAGCGESTDTHNINKSATIANVTIPSSGTLGRFMGKLDTLVIASEDLPVAYGPYKGTDDYQDYGYYKASHLKEEEEKAGYNEGDLIQLYIADKIVSANDYGLSSVDLSFHEFKDTATAAKNYAYNKGYYLEMGIKSFSNIKDEHFYYGDTSSESSNSQYSTTRWGISILIDNLWVNINIDLPATATATEINSIVDNWYKKVEVYQPGTAADVTAENASGI
ncbi:MAG: hypothetical protein WC528_00425 [Patescibacteria group bacterium]